MSTKPLNMNAALTTLQDTDTGVASNPSNVADGSFFIVKPNNDTAIFTIQSGGNDVQTPEVPAGFPIPYPVSFNWNNNTASLNNGSVRNAAEFEAGYFGMPAQPNVCQSGDASLTRFENTTFRTTLQPKTLTVKCSEPAIVGIIIGSSLPIFVAVNVDGNSLQGPYKELVNQGVLETQLDGTYTNRTNFSGASVTVVNISNGSTPVQVSLF
ncbi:hypothetical protein [Pseudoalteromonas sp. S16_S37]|uniref:hypothetical protein n=1 Tax=Pseudoalteromonas sp. S16_S37 TaxID=2720228 RepID=UPI001680BFCA|nr:hypothetical protein [Pseudoalteromonas sp. S16_S37]MBD1580881.1 hypothetical protein [Pseudoalteromonas sp. S16_S37]